MDLRALWYDGRFRALLFQMVLLLGVFAFCYTLFANLQSNLAARGIASGFGFLQNQSGFGIIQHLIEYSESSSYFRVFWVGILNTLLVSMLGIVIATVLGFIVGIARLSRHWMVAKLAFGYVELLRNIPLLLQIFFWYFVVLRAAPMPRQSVILGSIQINNRGIYMPAPVIGSDLWIVLVGLLGLLILSLGLLVYARRYQSRTGGTFAVWRWIGIFFCAWLGALWAFDVIAWEVPELRGFNFVGGWVLIPEMVALLISLSLYTASFIAEIVRSGILSVDQGQWEAASALGLRRGTVLKRIVIPQALRVILPPLTNQYLNLTKNSSLAAAIAYPDLVSVFAGTTLNQTGQAVEVIGMTMAVYLTISLTISAVMLIYEKKTQWGKP